MKVLPFKHLFDAQHVVPLSGEPLEIATTPDGLFLVATTAGIQVYNIPTTNTIDSEDNPNYGLIYSIPAINREISSLAYVPSTDCIATLEKESDRSVISVARIYYNWRSDISKLTKPTDQVESLTSKGLQVETIPSASSLVCIAACPFTDKIAVATRSEISVWATTTTLRSEDSNHVLCIPQKIFDVDLSVSPSAVFKLSLINQYLCYSTLSDVHVVRVVTSILSDAETELSQQNRSLKPADNQTIAEDEFYFECNFDDGGMQQFQLSVPSLTPEQTGQYDSRSVAPQKFSSEIPSAIRSEFKMQSQIRANKESGFRLESSSLVFYQTFERNNDRTMDQEVHTAILLPEFTPVDSMLDLTTYRPASPTSQVSVSDSIPISRLRCVISTQHKGYIYDIDVSRDHAANPELVTTYSYSAPTIAASCSNFLYTLSETGLEIYTLRCKDFGEFGHLEGASNITSPSTVNPAMNTFPGPCLVSIQSFIGLCRIEVVPFTDVLLLICKEPEKKSRSRSSSVSGQSAQTQPRGGGWNLYVLTSTSVHTLYEEIITQAAGYHESNPSVYYQLVLEMHVLLRSKLGQLNAQLKSSSKRTTNITTTGSLLNIHLESKNFHDMYRKSSGLLADFYFDHGDYQKSSRFYCLSWRSLSQVFTKMVQAPKSAIGHIIEYLDYVLFSSEQTEVIDEDENLATKIIYYYQQVPSRLSDVVLHSKLKLYPKPLVLEMLEKRKSNNKQVLKDSLARAILYSQTTQYSKAITEINEANPEQVVEYIKEHPDLIVCDLPETSQQRITLSDAAIIIGISQPWSLLEILVHLPLNKEFVNARWELLASFKSRGTVFERKLESDVKMMEICFLEWCLEQKLAENELQDVSSMILVLVELYASVITFTDVILETETTSKVNQSVYEQKWKNYHFNMLWNRPVWLNRLPPFNSQSGQTLNVLCLKKLQGILTNKSLQQCENMKEIVQHILNKNYSPEVVGILTLLSFAAIGNLEKSFGLLIESSPELFLDFAKQYCNKPADWMIALCFLCQTENQHTLNEILQYLAKTLPLSELLEVIPQNGNIFFFVEAIKHCIQIQEANTLRKHLTASFSIMDVD